jgi:hypothetical protein
MDMSQTTNEAHHPKDLARLELTLVASIKLMKRTRRELQRLQRKSGQHKAQHDRRSVN